MREHWIAAWGCASTHPSRMCAEWIHDTTVRLQMQMTVPGKGLKFHFTNLYDPETAVIEKLTVSVATEGNGMDGARCMPITFAGERQCRIPYNKEVISDPVDLLLRAGEVLVVNLYFKDFTRLSTGCRGEELDLKRWCCDGDQTDAAFLPFGTESNADMCPFLHTIEILAPAEAYSVVAFGDSITAQTWPDRLKRRVMELGRTDVAVVRKGIGGSRILREYTVRQYDAYGKKGTDRFAREVLLPGVKKVFILHGINDIIHPTDGVDVYRPLSELPTAREMIEGLQYYIETAHAHGIEVYLSPVLPFRGHSAFCAHREAIREEVNRWIREEAKVEGVLAFADAVTDPQTPTALYPAYDCGDHLHPSNAGAQAMADSIPESYI